MNHSTPKAVQLASALKTTDSGRRALVLTVAGRLDSSTTAQVWDEAVRTIDQDPESAVILDASGLEYCDGSGISLFLELGRRQTQRGAAFRIEGLQPEFHRLLELYNPAEIDEASGARPRRPRLAEEVGRAFYAVWKDGREMVTFVGELASALVHAAIHPGTVRWKDAFHVAEMTGVNALPIVAMISFLVGLIMAFQAAIPMRMFGAEIFVANLIALSMIRELGPLMTAIILAGRSGSSFAAELGTMTVNEEIDALTTMGLDPVRFLVVPRVMAGVLMTPLLTAFADLVGLVGGALVLLSLGYPLVTYVNQVVASVDYVDLLGGLLKSLVFGIMISGIGCLRGLQTGTGASAVGESTTRAVVSGIILIVVVDGIFSVTFFYLGI